MANLLTSEILESKGCRKIVDKDGKNPVYVVDSRFGEYCNFSLISTDDIENNPADNSYFDIDKYWGENDGIYRDGMLSGGVYELVVIPDKDSIDKVTVFAACHNDRPDMKLYDENGVLDMEVAYDVLNYYYPEKINEQVSNVELNEIVEDMMEESGDSILIDYKKYIYDTHAGWDELYNFDVYDNLVKLNQIDMSYLME